MGTKGLDGTSGSVLRRGLKAPGSGEREKEAGSSDSIDREVQKVCRSAIATPDGSAHQPGSENGTGVQGSGGEPNELLPVAGWICVARCPNGDEHTEVVNSEDELPERIYCRCGAEYDPKPNDWTRQAVLDPSALILKELARKALAKKAGTEGSPTDAIVYPPREGEPGYLRFAVCPSCGGLHSATRVESARMSVIGCRCGKRFTVQGFNPEARWFDTEDEAQDERLRVQAPQGGAAAVAAKTWGNASREGLRPRTPEDVQPATVDRDFRELPGRKGDEGAPRAQTPPLHARPHEPGTCVDCGKALASVNLIRCDGCTKKAPVVEASGVAQKTPHDWTAADHIAEAAKVAPRNVRVTPAELKKQGEVYRAICPRCESFCHSTGTAPKPHTCEHCGEAIADPGWVLWGEGVASELREKFEREALAQKRGTARVHAAFSNRSPSEAFELGQARMVERVKEELLDAGRHVAEAMYALGRAAAVSEHLGEPAFARWLREASERLHSGKEHADRVTIVLGLADHAGESRGLEWCVTASWGERLPARLLRRHGPLVLLDVEQTAAPSWWSMQTWEPLDDCETGPRRGWTLECRGGVR